MPRMKSHTQPKSLESMTGPELVERYNAAAERLDRKAVKRFKSRAEGVAKVRALEAELQPAKKAGGGKGPVQDPAKSSGAYIRELIREGGRTRQQIADTVLERFPDHRTTVSDVSWNRWKMRKDGEEVPAFQRPTPAKKAESAEADHGAAKGTDAAEHDATDDEEESALEEALG